MDKHYAPWFTKIFLCAVPLKLMPPDKDFMIEPKDESQFITDIKITQRKIEI